MTIGFKKCLLILAAALSIAGPVNAQSEIRLRPVAFGNIEGWAAADLELSLSAFQRSCREVIAEGRAFGRSTQFGGRREDWIPVCREALKSRNARAFFELEFGAYTVEDLSSPDGLFTGYFEPEAEGCLERGGDCQVPLYGRPDDLVSFDPAQQRIAGLKYGRIVEGKPEAFSTRKEIEQGALAGRKLELAWLKSWADAYFIHIQGSGRVRLADGKVLRLAYDGKSGRPYTSIGAILVERGIFTRDTISMQAIRQWMADHPGDARELMWQNESFIFFREAPPGDPGLGPPGAQEVQLTPEISLAVDRSIWMFGTPVWLTTTHPDPQDQSSQPFRNLMIAQDTGSAIRGAVRGDVFWGWGDRAAAIAGHMKSPGRMIALLPHAVARSLQLP